MCFAVPHSPRPSPFPPPPPPPRYHSGLCSAASQVVWACPTACIRPSPDYELRSSRRVPPHHPRKKDAGSPGSRAWSFHTCKGSSTAQGQICTRLLSFSRISVLPSAYVDSVGTLEIPFSRLNTLPVLSPVTASRASLRMSVLDSGPLWLAKPSM